MDFGGRCADLDTALPVTELGRQAHWDSSLASVLSVFVLGIFPTVGALCRRIIGANVDIKFPFPWSADINKRTSLTCERYENESTHPKDGLARADQRLWDSIIKNKPGTEPSNILLGTSFGSSQHMTRREEGKLGSSGDSHPGVPDGGSGAVGLFYTLNHVGESCFSCGGWRLATFCPTSPRNTSWVMSDTVNTQHASHEIMTGFPAIW
ncbi:hypothetical protein B0T20DRAFT_212569 [Sordaria brevicollis]|uniref:Uncharacterized protein n=1 Tax=Sordaria brevicollis TaxID=83679 RepID=A0AAE0PFI0_SORBR|nr:hypothetical protein B0T20DRAFT_212569 [Sordaria brevicollis]